MTPKTTSELYATIKGGLAWCNNPCNLICTRRFAATLPDKNDYPCINGDTCKNNGYRYNVTFNLEG